MNTSVTLFPEYQSLDINFVAPSRECPPVTVESDPMLSQIFVPDPVTNIPRSDIHLVLSKDSNPVVSQFIRDNLMRPLDVNTGVPDSDMALDMVKSRQEDIYHYAERMRAYIKEHAEDAKDKNS